MKSIYLPAGEDTKLEISGPDIANPIVIDLMELDGLINESNNLAKETGQHWLMELTDLFSHKYGVSLTRTQAFLIYDAVRKAIDELKKKLFIK
jgi:hypothetical protein